jgi:transposase
MDRTAVSRLLRCAWQTVTDLVGRVVQDHLATDRLEGLRRIGVDEIGYRRNRQFLTVVADHDTGRVVWIGDGKRSEALTSFFDALGPDRCQQIEAVSMDMGRAYVSATTARLPHAAICLDAFHLIKWAGEALERVFRSHTLNQDARRWRHSRYLLRSSPDKLSTIDQVELLRLRRRHEEIGRAYELKEGLRDLFRIPSDQATAHLIGWIGDARTSDIPAFELLARRVTKHYDGIINSVEQRLSNSRLEGINAKIRLINARGFGHHSLDSLAAMIYLNLGGISIRLPTET